MDTFRAEHPANNFPYPWDRGPGAQPARPWTWICFPPTTRGASRGLLDCLLWLPEPSGTVFGGSWGLLEDRGTVRTGCW
eukprot:3556906-Pyramimonas_sp.AAC.1